MKAKLYFDGGSRGNPGPSAGGAVLIDDNNMSTEIGHFMASATNNEAEYTGLIIGLTKAKELGIKHISIFGDSSLVINHILGQWECQAANLQPLYEQAHKLYVSFPKRSLKWVPRKENKLADAVCNAIMDTAMGIVPQSPITDLPQAKPQNKNIERLNQKGPNADFGEWARLKVPGARDSFTALRLPKLKEQVPPEVQEAIATIWSTQNTTFKVDLNWEFTEKVQAQCYRWYLRGLNSNCAVRKVRVDHEITLNAIKKH